MNEENSDKFILYKEQDVAKKLGVTQRSLQRWRAAGSGPPYIKMARHVRYKLDDVWEWLNSRRRISTADDRMQSQK